MFWLPLLKKLPYFLFQDNRNALDIQAKPTFAIRQIPHWNWSAVREYALSFGFGFKLREVLF